VREGVLQNKSGPTIATEFGLLTPDRHSVSALVGAIWQVSDKPAFDVAYRHAVTNGRPVEEIRAGMTFGFQLIPFERMGG
jgi:hypothetical protein